MVLRHFRSGLLILVCLFFVRATTFAQKSYDDKHVEVSLRAIGHQFLLKIKDSSSRVLPIEKNGQQYKISFEAAFAVNPDDLIEIVNENLKESNLAKAYILEVAEVKSGAIAYSYEIDSAKQLDALPCRGRVLPKANYNILITLKKEGISFHSTNRPKSRSAQNAPLNISKIIIYTLIFLIAIGAGVFFLLKRKKQKPESEDESEIDTNIISIGEYQFDKRTSILSLDGAKEELSGKEAELLLALIDKPNETQERDDLLKKVWGDEGDYIGRTLDVFISKLRKKLEADPKIKITNIRGVGYKLVLED